MSSEILHEYTTLSVVYLAQGVLKLGFGRDLSLGI